MKQIIVNIKCDLGSVPNLETILPKEFEAAKKLKEKGVLEHVFTKNAGNGAILVFKGIDSEQAQKYVSDLPLAPYFGTVVYTAVEKQF